MPEPLIAMMQPCASRAAPWRDAVKAFLRPTRRGYNRIELEQGTSSTPRTFNMLWADVRNRYRKGEVSHALMIHDDIAPDHDGAAASYDYLDVLMDEMAATGCDFLSAVVPIKDGHGLSSTAVDSEDDPWVVRRLTMTEIHHLPATFLAGDVPWNKHGGCLLPNTGLWLAKLGPWCLQTHFQFTNTIRTRGGVDHSVDVAEDWDFGRQLYALGLDVRCTRKVKLAHGEPRFHNRCGWGDWPTDMAYLNYRRLGEPELEGWKFPEDVTGWLTEVEGQALAELARGKVVLEIGSYCGRSTVCLAQTAAKVHAVDTFDGRATTHPRDTLPDFMESLVRYGVMAKVTVYRGASSAVVPSLEDKVDLAFIDGNHSRQSVLQDARACLPLLKPGGLLAFHDFNSPGDVGVRQAVEELVAGGAEVVALHETVAVVKMAA